MPSTGGYNSFKGLKGRQPKINRGQREALMLVWSQNRWKTSVGKKFLLDKFGIEVSDKGLYNWKIELKGLYDSRDEHNDQTVDWSDLQTLSDLSHIPVHAKEFRQELYEMWEVIQEHFLNKEPPIIDIIEPTYRRLKWWAYMYQYYSYTVPVWEDKLYIANIYVTAEMLSDWSRNEFLRESIDKWLLLKPWRSRQYMEKYVQLIKDEIIPPLEEILIGPETFKTHGYLRLPTYIATYVADSFSIEAWPHINSVIEGEEPAEYGIVVDELFDYNQVWRFLLPSQRYNKDIMEDWVRANVLNRRTW